MADASQNNEGIDNLRNAHDELKGKYETLQSQHRSLMARTVFKEAGLNPKHANLFLQTQGDEAEITAEAVTTFVKEYDLNTAPAPEGDGEGEGDPTPANQPEGTPTEGNPEADLQAMSGAGSQGTGQTPPSSPSKKYSMEEFNKLMSDDPAKATQAYRDGEVEHADGNVFVDKAKREGVLR